MPASRRLHAPSLRLSSTDSGANNCRPSGTCAIPSATRACAGTRSMDRFSNMIRPPEIGCTPEMARIRVVLPAPLAPTRVTISPAANTEIGFDHSRIGADPGGRPLRERATVGKHVDAVGDVHHQPHVMLDQND